MKYEELLTEGKVFKLIGDKTIRVTEDPLPNQIKSMLRMSQYKEVRGYYGEDNVLYTWVSENMIHYHFVSKMRKMGHDIGEYEFDRTIVIYNDPVFGPFFNHHNIDSFMSIPYFKKYWVKHPTISDALMLKD